MGGVEKGTIVVVDDEPNIADLVGLYLEREGYRVLKAPTGDAGLEAFRRLYDATMKRVGARPYYFFPQGYYEALAEGLGLWTCPAPPRFQASAAAAPPAAMTSSARRRWSRTSTRGRTPST